MDPVRRNSLRRNGKKKKKLVVRVIGKKKKKVKRKKKRKKIRKRRKKIDWDIYDVPYFTARRCGYQIFISRSLDYLHNVGCVNHVARIKKYNQIREEIFTLIKEKKLFPKVFIDEDISPLKEVNLELYSNENLEKREKLYTSRRIRFWVFKIYESVKHDKNGEIPKLVFIEIMKVAHGMLLRKYHKEYTDENLQEDINYYCSEKFEQKNEDRVCQISLESSIPWEQFFKGIFEIADSWTNSVEEDDYAQFIRNLFRNLCKVMKQRKYDLHRLRKIYGVNSEQVIMKYKQKIICNEKSYGNLIKSLNNAAFSETESSSEFSDLKVNINKKKKKQKSKSVTGIIDLESRKKEERRKRILLRKKKKAMSSNDLMKKRKELEILTLKEEEEFIRNLREENLKRVRRKEFVKRKKEKLRERRVKRMERKMRIFKKKKMREEQREKKRKMMITESSEFENADVKSRYRNATPDRSPKKVNNWVGGETGEEERKEIKVKTMTFDLLAGMGRF